MRRCLALAIAMGLLGMGGAVADSRPARQPTRVHELEFARTVRALQLKIARLQREVSLLRSCREELLVCNATKVNHCDVDG
ncbi:MAG: hypothetical protein AAF430_01400 [Myxococcota bacterium]